MLVAVRNVHSFRGFFMNWTAFHESLFVFLKRVHLKVSQRQCLNSSTEQTFCYVTSLLRFFKPQQQLAMINFYWIKFLINIFLWILNFNKLWRSLFFLRGEFSYALWAAGSKGPESTSSKVINYLFFRVSLWVHSEIYSQLESIEILNDFNFLTNMKVWIFRDFIIWKFINCRNLCWHRRKLWLNSLRLIDHSYLRFDRDQTWN